MSISTVEVSLGGLTLRVPAYESTEKTQDIADEINSRLKLLETSSSKINTQAFALLAAYEYAKATRELRDEMASVQKRLAERVGGVTMRIDDLTRIIEEST
ncbi:MAG: cell division protein ZapA [Candidatus Hydrogenedentes bacterium]|nr:cell division protein ZapA [Candidatus Hydrogenedentota bacterium]